jgi:hypothetical protein
MDLREIGWGGKDWIHLVEERDQWRAVVNMIVNLHTPQNVCKFFRNEATGSFPRSTTVHGVC